MSLVFSLLVVSGYLLSPSVGFLLTVGVAIAVFLRTSRPFLERLLVLLVITMPLYMTPVVGGLPPLSSWTTLILLFLSLFFLLNSRPAHPIAVYSVVVFVAVGLMTALLVTGLPGLYYLVQLLLFIIPVLLAYKARHYVAATLDASSGKRLLHVFSATIVTMAIGVLLQSQLYTRAGITLGNVSFFQARVSYDLTIPAFSVLSGILAMGIVLGPILWRNSSKISGILIAILSSTAILVNSSRTGLAAGGIVLILMILFPPRGVRRTASRLAVIPVGGFLWLLYESLQSSSRFSESGGLFDDNGRFESVTEPMGVFLDSVQNVLIGIGYVYEGEKPHNFVIETLVSSGIIAFLILMVWGAALLFYMRGSEWFYLILTLLAGSMFYAGFYAVKVFTVVAILAIVSKSIDSLAEKSREENSPEKSSLSISGAK